MKNLWKLDPLPRFLGSIFHMEGFSVTVCLSVCPSVCPSVRTPRKEITIASSISAPTLVNDTSIERSSQSTTPWELKNLIFFSKMFKIRILTCPEELK